MFSLAAPSLAAPSLAAPSLATPSLAAPSLLLLLRLRSLTSGHPKVLQQTIVPIQRLQVHEHSPRRVGDVGDVKLLASEVVHEPTVDGAEAGGSSLELGTSTLNILHYPNELGHGKVRSEGQAAQGAKSICARLVFEALGDAGGTNVVPNNCVVERLASGSVPNYRGFTLIGNPNGREVNLLKVRSREGGVGAKQCV